MNKVKWYGALLALFFVLMGAATVYSCITNRNHLPLVSLALTETMLSCAKSGGAGAGVSSFVCGGGRARSLGQGVCLPGDPAAQCKQRRADHPDLC